MVPAAACWGLLLLAAAASCSQQLPGSD